VLTKLLRQRAIGVLGLREDEQPARFEIDAVHDVHGGAARAPREEAREVVAVALGRGRRQQARGLVDDDDVRVLEDDRERRQARLVLRAGLAARRRRRALERAAHVRDDLLAGVHELPGDLHAASVDEDAADVEEQARAAARQARHARRERLVQAQPHLGVTDGERDTALV